MAPWPGIRELFRGSGTHGALALCLISIGRCAWKRRSHLVDRRFCLMTKYSAIYDTQIKRRVRKVFLGIDGARPRAASTGFTLDLSASRYFKTTSVDAEIMPLSDGIG